MNPEQLSERQSLHVRVSSLILRTEHGLSTHEGERDGLLIDLARYQAKWVSAYGRFCAQGRSEAPALPTDLFRFARVSSRSEADELRVFESSGTTQHERSRHPFADLSLYHLAAERGARHSLFPDRDRMRLFVLAPTEGDLPTSSLSHMLAQFMTWFGASGSAYIWPIDPLRTDELTAHLQQAERDNEPVALLGTSFAFVHALEALRDRRFRLPSASRIMQTGGFKGRTREVAPDAMRDWLSDVFGIPVPFIVAEYGMTELSSQLYENTLRESALDLSPTLRRLCAPPWVRAQVLNPETMLQVPVGEVGLLRLDDIANLDSVSAVQTADLARREEDGFVLLGRATNAVARGCSITADELLGKQHRE